MYTKQKPHMSTVHVAHNTQRGQHLLAAIEAGNVRICCISGVEWLRRSTPYKGSSILVQCVQHVIVQMYRRTTRVAWEVLEGVGQAKQVRGETLKKA
jgi:hypothetical protein